MVYWIMIYRFGSLGSSADFFFRHRGTQSLPECSTRFYFFEHPGKSDQLRWRPPFPTFEAAVLHCEASAKSPSTPGAQPVGCPKCCSSCGKPHGIHRILKVFEAKLLQLVFLCRHHWVSRRRFRNQTSDNMDRWKSRGGKSQRREEKSSREKIRKEKESEERRRRCAKRQENRKTLCFSNDLKLRRVEK